MSIGRNRSFFYESIMALVFAAVVSSLWAQAGSLTVGTKVIYPGGTDQPPKEKDTGITFKVGNIHGSVGSEETVDVSFSQENTWQELIDSGKSEDLLKALRGKSDPLAATFRVLAYMDLGVVPSARREAEKALKNPNFPEDLKERIEEALPQPEPTGPNDP